MRGSSKRSAYKVVCTYRGWEGEDGGGDMEGPGVEPQSDSSPAALGITFILRETGTMEQRPAPEWNSLHVGAVSRRSLCGSSKCE